MIYYEECTIFVNNMEHGSFANPVLQLSINILCSSLSCEHTWTRIVQNKQYFGQDQVSSDSMA